jgi:hypothetical protein
MAIIIIEKYNFEFGTSKGRNTLSLAEIHLENAEIHLKIFQMNLQWIENDEINLRKVK